MLLCSKTVIDKLWNEAANIGAVCFIPSNKQIFIKRHPLPLLALHPFAKSAE